MALLKCCREFLKNSGEVFRSLRFFNASEEQISGGRQIHRLVGPFRVDVSPTLLDAVVILPQVFTNLIVECQRWRLSLAASDQQDRQKPEPDWNIHFEQTFRGWIVSGTDPSVP